MTAYKSPRTGTAMADKVLDDMRAKMPPEEVKALDAALATFTAAYVADNLADDTEGLMRAFQKLHQDTRRSRAAVKAHDSASDILDRVRKTP